MTTDVCGEDVIVQLTSPQILSLQAESPLASNAGVQAGVQAGTQAGAQAGARAAAAGMECGRLLLQAARLGDCNTVLELMAKGAPFTTDWLGTSPLHLAAAHNHLETCAVLLRAGVCCDSRTKVERTPLHLAAYAGHRGVVALLLDHGAMLECRDMLRMTPLHWAAARGHLAVAAELVRRGADTRARCKFRKTPRCLAARHHHADLLALLETAALQEQMTEDTKPPQEMELPQSVPIPMALAKEKIQPEKTIIIESKTEPVPVSLSAGAGAGGAAGLVGEAGGAGGTPGAALLRAHGITLLPADRGCTLLTALRSGRTVVLSDAGKLMLKESGNNEPILVDNVDTEVTTISPVLVKSVGETSMISSGNSGNSGNIVCGNAGNTSVTGGNRNMVVRARALRPVRGGRGLKVVTLNKPDNAYKKIINPADLQQVKVVQVSQGAGAGAGAGAATTRPRPALKLLLNKANLTRLLASTRTAATPHTPVTHAAQQPFTLHLQTNQENDLTMNTTDPMVDLSDAESEHVARNTSAKHLRTQLLQAHQAIASLTAELRACKARLAKYESHQ